METKTDRYAELCAAFPLRPIGCEEDYRRALEVIGPLAAWDHAGPVDPDDDRYADALAELIEQYEAGHENGDAEG